MSNLRRIAILSIAALLAACDTAAPSAAPGSRGPDTTAPAGSAGPDGTQGAAATTPPSTIGPIDELLTLTLDESGPFISHEDGPGNSDYALPAAAARTRDGGYVLFVVWFAQNDPDVRITVSTSADGETWDVGQDDIFEGVTIGNPDPGPIPSAAVQLEDGSWQLFGWSADAANSQYFASWRASAPDLDGPWTLDKDRILTPGTPGTWDSQTASITSVQRTASGYVGWYEGQTPGNQVRGDLGYATSPDGLSWTKFNDPATTTAELAASDPVIHRGVCGAGTALAVFQPQVEPAGEGYTAVFGGFGSARDTMDLFGAVSDDGVAWTCGTPEPILRASDIPGSEGIHQIASLPLDDGSVMIIIESLGGDFSDLWRATVSPAPR